MTPAELLAVSVIPIGLALYVEAVSRVWLWLGEPVDYYLMRFLRMIATLDDRLTAEIDAAAAARKVGT